MGEHDLRIFKKEFPDKWKYLTKKLAYPYEYFNSIEDYNKPVDNLKNKNFFSNIKKINVPMIKKLIEQEELLKNSILKMEKN